MRRERDFLEAVPFTSSEYGSIVQTNYPGAHDREYRGRVDELVGRSQAAWPHIPRYEYRPEEHETWTFVSKVLVMLQDRYACSAFLEARERLGLPMDRVPQLDQVSAKMEAATGFMLAPVGGLLEKGEFLSMLERKVMRCTPYIRHHAFPFFTPEPDIIHELRGHAPMFMHPEFVQMSQHIGRAARQAVETGNSELLDLIGLFYWYTVEYGLVMENGAIKVFGAGSNGGIEDLMRSVNPTVEKKPLSIDAIRGLTIDYDAPQKVFYVAESFDHVVAMANDLVNMA